MTSRASWKGFLKVAEITCPVALYSAVSASDRIAFQMVNRKTGHLIKRRFIDSVNGELVEADNQVKGYEIASGEYIVLEPEEIASVLPDQDKTISISNFVEMTQIDELYLDRPYYLAASSSNNQEAYDLIRLRMQAKNVVAVARAVMFRRVRNLLLRPHGSGIVATTLNFDYEVRSAETAFDEIVELKPNKEMRDLAEHIIKTKTGSFAPSDFKDRYETALADVVKAKLEGRTIKAQSKSGGGKVVDLMTALQQSAALQKRAVSARSKPKSETQSRKTTRSANRKAS